MKGKCTDCRLDFGGECYRHMLARIAAENIKARGKWRRELGEVSTDEETIADVRAWERGRA